MEQVLSRENEKLGDLVLSRAKGKISTELDNETVILDIESGLYSGLDPVGTTIWNSLEQKVTFSGLVSEIMEKYDVSEEQCATDLLDFLNELLEVGLILLQND